MFTRPLSILLKLKEHLPGSGPKPDLHVAHYTLMETAPAPVETDDAPEAETSSSVEDRQQAQFKQICASPSVWVMDDFLSGDQCDHLITLAKERLKPSLTVDPTTGNFIQVDERTSSLTFLPLRQDAVVEAIEERISAIINIPVENGEGFQILRYQIGEEYKHHHDYFDPAKSGSAKALAKGGQRVVTILLYLTDVEAGGETVFPTANLKVPPKRGQAVIFYNLYADGQLDSNSLHGSDPVIQGEKWVATKWMREREYK